MELDNGVVAQFYGDVVETIKESDPEDSTGFVKNVEAGERFAEFENKLNELGNEEKFDEALALAEETLESGGFTGERQQNVMFIKGIILAETGELDESIKAMDAAKVLAPETALAASLEQMKTRIYELKSEKEAEKNEAE